MKTKSTYTFVNAVMCITLSAMLAACGHSTPSESDAKEAVKTSLGDCKYVDLSDFEKVNGQQGEDENHYQLQIKYRLSIKADGDQRDKLKAHLDALKQRNQLLKEDEEMRASAMNENRASELDSDPKSKEMDQQQQALFAQLTTTYGPATFLHEASQACPHFSSAVLENLISKVDDAEFDGKNSLDFSGTLSMVKTDNGWQEDR